jgi:hypothetical protein
MTTNYVLARESCRHEKSSTAPKNGAEIHAAFASGTTGTCLSSWPRPLSLSPLPWLSLSLSCSAYASMGRIETAAAIAQILPKVLQTRKYNILCTDYGMLIRKFRLRFGGFYNSYETLVSDHRLASESRITEYHATMGGIYKNKS